MISLPCYIVPSEKKQTNKETNKTKHNKETNLDYQALLSAMLKRVFVLGKGFTDLLISSSYFEHLVVIERECKLIKLND